MAKVKRISDEVPFAHVELTYNETMALAALLGEMSRYDTGGFLGRSQDYQLSDDAIKRAQDFLGALFLSLANTLNPQEKEA